MHASTNCKTQHIEYVSLCYHVVNIIIIEYILKPWPFSVRNVNTILIFCFV